MSCSLSVADGSSQADYFSQGFGEARRLDDAFDLVEALESGRAPGRHVELTDVHLNTLVNACAHAGQSLIPTCRILANCVRDRHI